MITQQTTQFKLCTKESEVAQLCLTLCDSMNYSHLLVNPVISNVNYGSGSSKIFAALRHSFDLL